MKKQSKITFGLLLGTALTAISVVGATAGSLAWYAYSRSVTLSFIGTSIAKSALLNVGIVDDSHYIDDEHLALYELTREEYDNHSIVFTHKTDGLDYRAIREYLRRSVYAIDMLFPLSTQARGISETGALQLYESPNYGETSLTKTALTSHYVRLPLAFRMSDIDGSSIEDIDIWLTDTSVQASGENIHQAVRLFIENSQRKFLMKPADRTTNTGSTKVGGLLDLDGDGTYDYNQTYLNEYYYGQYDGTLVNDTSEYGIDKEHAEYDNVNGVEELVESTFYAKHYEHTYCVDLEQLTPKVVEYQTFGTVKPLVDANGTYYSGATGMPIATTDSDDGVGYATFTIFIEGWDHAVVDKAAGYSFNLGLRFEVNRS